MKRRIYLMLSILLALTVVFSACSTSSEMNYQDSDAAADVAMPEAMEDAGWGEEEYESPTSSSSTQDYGGHKVIKNAYMDIETKNFDADLAHIKEKAAELGGYVASSSISGTAPEEYGDRGRIAEITLRVPQEKLDVFMEDTRGLAKVTNEDLGTEDITYEYVDTASRLEIYQTQYDRLIELLKEATVMEDIITLENELTRITYEIESLTSTLKNWDDMVDFSTVSISLYERNVFSSVSGSKDTIGTRMGEGFMDTLNGVVMFFEDFLVWIVSALPVLVILVVLAVIIILIAKAAVKRRKKRQKAFVPPSPYHNTAPQSPYPQNGEENKTE